MTVTIAPQATDSALPTPDDIAASANLPLLQGRSQQDLVLAQLEGGNQRPFAAADTRHWRGVMALDGGYRAGLSLYAPAASPYAGVDGAEMLGRLRAGIVLNIQ